MEKLDETAARMLADMEKPGMRLQLSGCPYSADGRAIILNAMRAYVSAGKEGDVPCTAATRPEPSK